MTTASPAPPLGERGVTNSYSSYHRRKSLKKPPDGKENASSKGSRQPRWRDVVEDGDENGDEGVSSSRRRIVRGIKSAGSMRREIYKTHKAEIQFPVPHAPAASSNGSPRKGRLANGRCTQRKSRSAAASLFNLESRGSAYGDSGNFSETVRSQSWPEEGPGSGFGATTSSLNETIYGLPAYGTPTLALREKNSLLEKEREEMFYRLQAYEEALSSRDEEVRALKERVAELEEGAKRAEEERVQREEAERERERAREEKMTDNCVFLTEEVERTRSEMEMVQQEYQKLEFAFEESEAQRSEYEKRCYFLLLDSDNDGLIHLPELATHEVLLPYAPELLEICFSNWNYQSGIRNLMSWEDFSLFFQYVEEKTTKSSQTYWFNVLDVDGDGYVGIHDMRWLYDKVDKSEHQGCIEFEDLLCQLYDMVRPQDPSRGFTLSELRKSKLSTGIIGILTNHNHMLLRRSTSEWATSSRSPDLPL